MGDGTGTRGPAPLRNTSMNPVLDKIISKNIDSKLFLVKIFQIKETNKQED